MNLNAHGNPQPAGTPVSAHVGTQFLADGRLWQITDAFTTEAGPMLRLRKLANGGGGVIVTADIDGDTLRAVRMLRGSTWYPCTSAAPAAVPPSQWQTRPHEIPRNAGQ